MSKSIDEREPQPVVSQLVTPDVVEGRRTRLRALLMTDYGWLYETVTSMDTVGRWRFRGAPPEPEHFPDTMWLGVHTQLVVESRLGEPMGLLTSYGVDLRCGYTKVACIFRDGYKHRGWPFEGLMRFIDHLFTHWPLRKIYFEAPDPVAVESGLVDGYAGMLDEEARLKEHDLFDGRYVDFLIYGLDRAHFYDRFSAVLTKGM